jgi:D-glycero-D-manno-heptose 1,7-bisphosphate phosphatase
MTFNALSPAVFLDRDGTINQDREDYVKSLEEFELLPEALRGIAALSKSDAKIVVVSNQSGIARGYFTLQTLDAMTERMVEAVTDMGGRIDGTYYCTHGPEDRCECRKPLTGLLSRAAKELHLDLSRSIMVGDSFRDMIAGHAAGCEATVLVLTGKTSSDRARHGLDWKTPPDLIAEDLGVAAPWIFRRLMSSGSPTAVIV